MRNILSKRLTVPSRLSELTGSLTAATVVQGSLSTTTGEVSTADTTMTTSTLPGGTYGFYPQLKAGISAYYAAAMAGYQNVNVATQVTPSALTASYVTNITLCSFAGGGTLYAQQRYIQASPPYDLGDGEIPLFVFVKLNALGDVLATYSAPEAPWHYNGPTDIKAERYDSGHRGYRKVKQFIAEHGSIQAARQAGMTRAQIAQALANSPMIEIEITQAMKNADMGLIPHPFGTLNAGETVVLLDPVSPFVDRASRLHESGESICELLHSGDIVIGNTDLPRNKPSGVLAVAPRWSLT